MGSEGILVKAERVLALQYITTPPETVPTGFMLIYAKSDGKLYKKVGDTETEIG